MLEAGQPASNPKLRTTRAGRYLTQARVKLERTQDDMADALGVSRGKVEHVESGRQTLAAEDVLRWCAEYGVDVVSLLKKFAADRAPDE